MRVYVLRKMGVIPSSLKVYLKSHESVGFMKIRCHTTSNLEEADKIIDKALAEVVCHTVNKCTNGEYYTVEEVEIDE